MLLEVGLLEFLPAQDKKIWKVTMYSFTANGIQSHGFEVRAVKDGEN